MVSFIRMEKIENLRKTIKNNLIKYRKSAGLTQVQLAEKLGYSDKSVSKWEREEGVPDIYILKEIADLYGVTVNDLISENYKSTKSSRIKTILSGRNKTLISLLSAGAIWAIAVMIYVIMDIVAPNTVAKMDNIYIYAIPISCIILIIFNSIWGKKIFNLFLISSLIWTSVLSLYVSFSIENISELFIIPIPLQILTILAFLFEKNKQIK